MIDEQGRMNAKVKKLRPFIGKQADAYKDLWITQDFRGRSEVEQLLDQELHRLFPNPDEITLPPPALGKLPTEGIRLGSVKYQQQSLPFFIQPKDLLRHVMIAGATGTGKTTLIYHFVQGLLEKQVPFFLFDFKLDYRPLLSISESLKVYTIGSSISPLPFNPLVEVAMPLVKSGKLTDLIPLFQISDVLCRAFYLGAGVRSVLNKGFAHVVRQWVEHGLDDEHTPTFRGVLEWVRTYEPKNDRSMRFREWKISTIRGLEMLAMGDFGSSLNIAASHHIALAELRKQNVVFELNLPEDLKTFFVEMLLLCMRQQNIHEIKSSPRGLLRNVMIIDESHNLLKESDEKIESQLQLALREHRGLGTGYIIADQTPSQLDKTAYANTHFKFFFSLDEHHDIITASNSLLLDREEQDWLAKLEVGRCICRYGTHDAFLLALEPVDNIKHTIVSDAEVRSRMNRDSRYSDRNTDAPAQQSQNPPSSLPDKNTQETTQEYRLVRFLAGILEEPFGGVHGHYKRHGFSTDRAEALRREAEAKGMIKAHTISLPAGGRTIIMELTPQGVEALRAAGYKAHYPYFVASPEHEYWKDRAAKHFESRGFKVEKEVKLEGDGIVDLLAVKNGETIAVEVETGKSDVKANFDKLQKAKVTSIVNIPTNPQAEEQVRKLFTQVNNTSGPGSTALPGNGPSTFTQVNKDAGRPQATAAPATPPASIKLTQVNGLLGHNPTTAPHGSVFTQVNNRPQRDARAVQQLSMPVKVLPASKLQESPEVLVREFFALPAAERLVLLDVAEYPFSTVEQRQARMGNLNVANILHQLKRNNTLEAHDSSSFLLDRARNMLQHIGFPSTDK